MSIGNQKELEISHIEAKSGVGEVNPLSDDNTTSMGAPLHGEQHQKELEHEFVIDTLAADYVDRTLVISSEENKRLRRKMFTL